MEAKERLGREVHAAVRPVLRLLWRLQERVEQGGKAGDEAEGREQL